MTEAENIPSTLTKLAVPIDGLTPYSRNPRRGDVDMIAESLSIHGQYRPIVVRSGSNEVLAGNHTLAAARQLGWHRIAATFVDVDDDTAARIVLVDNRASDVAGYDDDVLAELLAEFDDLAGTGYDEGDLTQLLGDSASEDDPADDQVPDLPAQPVSSDGDLWQLGDHRVLCGSSIEAQDVARLMGDTMADLVFTDPPYNVAYDPEARASTFSADRKANPLGEIRSDQMGDQEYLDFLRSCFEAVAERVRPGGAVYVCHADTQGIPVRLAFAEFFYLSSCLVWAKTVHTFGRADYHWRHEPILYGWREGAAHAWYGDRKQSTLWEFASEHYTGEKYQHPTQKPVALVKRAIGNSSPVKGLVLDPFGGSGSTLIAADRMGRRARLLELDPRYVDVICRRWQEHTGEMPVNEATGKQHDFVGGA